MNATKIFGWILGILFVLSASSCTIKIGDGESVDVGVGFVTATPGNNDGGSGSDVVPVPTIIFKKTAATYLISVLTGDVPKAGTDANVSINLIGDLGETSWVPLDNEGDDDFEIPSHVMI